MKIKFYKDKYKRLEPRYVFLVVLDSGNPEENWPNELTSYCPIGQHSAMSKDYLKGSAVEITKEQYLKVSDGLYTPEDYLTEGR